jgi:hypothetical protein
VLTVAKNRPATYWAHPSKDLDTDFDQACNGYPKTRSQKPEFSKSEYFYKTSVLGHSNEGHQSMLVDQNGVPKFSTQDRSDLVRFLQTL